MAKKETDALFGYADQPTHYEMTDGQEIPAGEVTAKAFARYCDTVSPDTANADCWNNLDESVRSDWCEKEAQIMDQAGINGAAAVDANASQPIQLSAAEILGAALIDAALTECKALDKPWRMMNADAQSEVLERITRQVKGAVRDTIRMLATAGAAHIVCELESITIKKGAKATLEIPKGELDQDILDAVGCQVILVVGSSLTAAADIQAPLPDPDQADMLGSVLGEPMVGDQPDDGMATHSDPED